MGRRPGASPATGFDGGRLRASLRGKTAELDAAIASYNSAVIDAVRDAADPAEFAARRWRANVPSKPGASQCRNRLRHRPLQRCQSRAGHPAYVLTPKRRAGTTPRRGRHWSRTLVAKPNSCALGGGFEQPPHRWPCAKPTSLHRFHATLFAIHHERSHFTTPVAPPPQAPETLTVVTLVSTDRPAMGGYTWYQDRHFEDDRQRYVQGNSVIRITPQIGGTVTAIAADDFDFVKAGQTLVQLDPADAGVALGRPKPPWDRPCARYAHNNNMPATPRCAPRSRCARPTSPPDRRRPRQDDLQRRQTLVGNGAGFQEELQHAQSQLQTAQNALASAPGGRRRRARQQRQPGLTEGARSTTAPACWLPQPGARSGLGRQRLPCRPSGWIRRRTVPFGPAGGSRYAAVVAGAAAAGRSMPASKEVQLRTIRLGQYVHLTAVPAQQKVEYTGTVARSGHRHRRGFYPAPQNATGNWIRWCSACRCVLHWTLPSPEPATRGDCRWKPRWA